MRIDPERLRHLRRLKQLTIEQLAEKSGISSRTLHRLESNSSTALRTRDRTVIQISKAMGVEADVLTGSKALPDGAQFDPAVPRSPVRVNLRMFPEKRLAAELVARRYGVRPSALFNIAPLLFTLIAEASLQWRREKLESTSEAVNLLKSVRGCEHVSRIAFVGASRVEEQLLYERKSIEQEDLFGHDTGYDHRDLGYDPDETNPFADYLGEMVRTLGLLKSRKVELPGVLEYGLLENMPDHEILSGDLDAITSGDPSAEWALRRGYARIFDIPEELMTEDRSDERVSWLLSKVPDDHPKSYSEALDRLADTEDLEGLFGPDVAGDGSRKSERKG